MTGGEATMSDEIGAEVSAWDGYISGRNLELVPGERIVQSWRTSEFGDEDEDSVITVVLQETEDGTLLTLEHSNVPDEHKSYEQGGWQSNYFEPMVAYFTELKEDAELKQISPSRRRPKLRRKARRKSRRKRRPNSQPKRAQKDRGQGSAAGERENIKTAGAAQSFIEQESCAEKEQRQSKQRPRDDGAHARKVECA